MENQPQPPRGEKFSFQVQNAIEKRNDTFTVREAPTDILTATLQSLQQQLPAAHSQLMAHINQLLSIGSMLGAVEYELDRRSKSLQIVSNLNGLESRRK